MAARNKKDPFIDFASDNQDRREDPTAPRSGPIGPFVEPEGLEVNANLLEAMKGSCPGHLMAVVCRVTSVRQVDSEDGGEQMGYDHCIHLQDLEHGRELVPYPTSELELIDQADVYCREGTLVVAYGRYVSEPGSRRGRRTMYFELHHLRPAQQVADLLGATQAERERARARIEELSARPGALAAYIESELADIYCVDVVNVAPRFKRMIRLVLLQAVSDGNMLPGSNPRLGLCFVSDPGQGKGVLARFALALSPSKVEVQPTLVTMAGFSVRVKQSKGQSWVMEPGAMARASRGVCVVHDVHRLPAKELKAYHGVMLSVGEEGRFLPTKASDTPMWAEVGLHLNGNHLHMMHSKPCPRGPLARLQDLGLPLDLFSRLDVVVALCLGDQIDKLAAELAKKVLPTRDEAAQAKIEERKRDLKVLVAVLRDTIKEVDLSQVEARIDQAVEEVNLVMREHMAQLRGVNEAAFPPTAMSLRTARALRKMTVASARLDGRTVATEGDVEVALSMAGFKLEVVRWVCGEAPAITPLGKFEQQYQRAVVMQEVRQQRMMETFGGVGPVDAEQVAAAVGVGRRVVERDLKQMGIGAAGGLYEVPTVLEHEKRKEAAELRGEKIQPAPEVDAEEAAVAELSRTLPHRFKDTLPDVPAAAKPALRMMVDAAADQRCLLVKALILYALAPELDMMLTLRARSIPRYVDGDGSDVPRASADVIVKALQEPDWEKRAGFALSVYTSSARLPTYTDALENGLAKLKDVPLGVRMHIESAIARRQFIDEYPEAKLAL